MLNGFSRAGAGNEHAELSNPTWGASIPRISAIKKACLQLKY